MKTKKNKGGRPKGSLHKLDGTKKMRLGPNGEVCRAYDHTVPVTVYRLAKQGLGNRDISRALGVSEKTFYHWVTHRHEVAYAIEEGRTDNSRKGESYMEYVHNHLPEELQETFAAITAPDRKRSPIAKLEAMIEDAGKRGRQNLLLHALLHYNWNLSKALEAVNVSHRKFRRWLEEDPEFSELIEEMDWHKKNFFEEKLVELVKAGEPSAVLFVNKTYNADRGYGAKKTVTKDVNVNVRGQVNHVPVSIDEIGLSPEEKRLILSKMRKNINQPRPIEAKVVE